MSPSISCIIPTHKRGDFLRECLNSVLSQTHLPDEIIVVSDVSDDAAAEICDRSAGDNGLPIRYVESPPGKSGASSSRNLGAALASSDFLAFLDDDDEWLGDYLADALRILENDSDTDAVVTWIEMFSGHVTAPGPAIRAGLAPHEVIAANPGATGSNIFLSRDSFDSIGGFDENLPVKNDTDFFYRFLNSGQRYAVNAKRLVRQRKHNQGQLTAKSEMRAAGVERYVAKHRVALTGRQLHDLKFSIHRMRRHSSSSRRARLLHLLLAARYYSLAQFRADRRSKDLGAFWNVAGFTETP